MEVSMSVGKIDEYDTGVGGEESVYYIKQRL